MHPPLRSTAGILGALVCLASFGAAALAQSPSADPSAETSPGFVDWIPTSPASDFDAGAGAIDLAETSTGGLVLVGTVGSADESLPFRAAAWSSADGMVWAENALSDADGTVARAVIDGPAGLVAVGADLKDGRALSWVSEDGGMTWTAGATLRRANFFDVEATEEGYVAVGARVVRGTHEGTIWRSRDGRDWRPARIEEGGTPERLLMAPGGRRVAAGVVSPSQQIALPVVWRERGRGRWSGEALPVDDVLGRYFINGVAANDESIALVLRWSSGDSLRVAVFVSGDGREWREALVPDGFISALGVIGGEFLALGPGMTWRSSDGATWVESAAPELEGFLPRAVVERSDGTIALAGHVLGAEPTTVEVWIGRVGGSGAAASPGSTESLDNG